VEGGCKQCSFLKPKKKTTRKVIIPEVSFVGAPSVPLVQKKRTKKKKKPAIYRG